MSKTTMLRTLGATTLLFSSLPLLAHHSFSSEFDAKKPVTLTGTISKVDWSEPHAYIYLNVKNESGKTEEWKLETASPVFLKQHGVMESSLKKGEQLTVNGLLSPLCSYRTNASDSWLASVSPQRRNALLR